MFGSCSASKLSRRMCYRSSLQKGFAPLWSCAVCQKEFCGSNRDSQMTRIQFIKINHNQTVMHSLGEFLDLFRCLRDHDHGRVVVQVDLENHPVLLSTVIFGFLKIKISAIFLRQFRFQYFSIFSYSTRTKINSDRKISAYFQNFQKQKKWEILHRWNARICNNIV